MARQTLLTRLRSAQVWALASFAAALPIGQAPTEISLGLGIAALIAHRLLAREWPHALRTPVFWWWLAWMAAAACSMHNSIDLAASHRGLIKLLKYGALYVLVVSAIDSARSLLRVLGGCLLGQAVVVLDGVWQAVVGTDLLYGHPPATYFGSVRRIAATFTHPVDLAIPLVSGCALAVALGLRGERRWRWPLLTLAGVTTVVIVLGRTRAGILAFAAAMVLLGWWLRRWVPVVLAAAGALLQGLTVPPEVREWAATMPSLLHQLTEPERLTMYWPAAVNMIRAHPWIGVGVNTFVKAYPAYRVTEKYGDIGPYAHNQYLQLTAEMGFLGLTAFLGVLTCVILALRRRIRRRTSVPLDTVVSMGLGAGLTGYLLIGLLESSLFYGRGSLLFWFLVGLIVAADGLAAARASSPSGAPTGGT